MDRSQPVVPGETLSHVSSIMWLHGASVPCVMWTGKSKLDWQFWWFLAQILNQWLEPWLGLRSRSGLRFFFLEDRSWDLSIFLSFWGLGGVCGFWEASGGCWVGGDYWKIPLYTCLPGQLPWARPGAHKGLFHSLFGEGEDGEWLQ